jgi:hypothetical protein
MHIGNKNCNETDQESANLVGTVNCVMEFDVLLSSANPVRSALLHL